jgi:hypothetical protein
MRNMVIIYNLQHGRDGIVIMKIIRTLAADVTLAAVCMFRDIIWKVWRDVIRAIRLSKEVRISS